MKILSEELERYLEEAMASDDPVLAEMQAEGEARKFPIVGPLVGRVCEQLSRSIGARDVFEMGSGFGYSTYWFARAVPADGRVVHTELSRDRSNEAKRWLRKGSLESRVHFELGDALEVITRFPGPFDVIFIDVEKGDYPEALELARSRVRVGGLIITDNVLWYGKVLAPKSGKGSRVDAETAGVLEYTRQAMAAEELLTTILPIRDGVAVSLRLR